MVIWTVVLVALAIGAFFYIIQDRAIYFPQSYRSEPARILSQERRAGRANRLLSFRTSQGQQRALYIGEDSAKKVWLMFGGNGARGLDWLPLIHSVPEATDVGFLLIDYPGYGWCEGSPDPQSIQDNVEGALFALAKEWKMERKELNKRVSCLGHSLGSAVALEAAARIGVREVVVISPFTNMLDMAKRIVGRPICYLLRHRFDNVKSLQRLEQVKGVQVMLFHGGEDRAIPVSMGRELSERFNGLVEYHEISGAGHNDILSYLNDELVEKLSR